MGYGTVNPKQVHDFALAVCDVVGHGANNSALELLKGTAAQETLSGTLKDPTVYGAGVGLCQCDRIAFDDVKARTPQKLKDSIFDAFGIRLDDVEHRELAFSPLLAMLWCRLHYRLIPEPIPSDVVGMANYWKKYYNTAAGRGTPEEFVKNFNLYVR